MANKPRREFINILQNVSREGVQKTKRTRITEGIYVRSRETQRDTQTDRFHRNLSGRVNVSESRWRNADQTPHATFSRNSCRANRATLSTDAHERERERELTDASLRGCCSLELPTPWGSVALASTRLTLPAELGRTQSGHSVTL